MILALRSRILWSRHRCVRSRSPPILPVVIYDTSDGVHYYSERGDAPMSFHSVLGHLLKCNVYLFHQRAAANIQRIFDVVRRHLCLGV